MLFLCFFPQQNNQSINSIFVRNQYLVATPPIYSWAGCWFCVGGSCACIQMSSAWEHFGGLQPRKTASRQR